jgi:DNA primase
MEENALMVELLDSIFGKSKLHYPSKGQISYDCPVCSYDLKGMDKLDGKGNLEINYAQHVFKCWVCGETHNTKGHLGYLIDRYGKRKDKELYELIRPDEFKRVDKEYDELKLPKDFKLATDGSQYHIPFREMRNYLKKRGVTDEMIQKHQIGYSLDGDYAYRIIIPSFDEEGELNYYTGRSWNPNSKSKYKNPEAEKQIIIFNESLIDWEQDIYLCEGPFDALFLPNSIALLGKKMSDLLFETLYDKAKKDIVIVLDSDAWEDSKRLYFKLSGGKLYGRIKVVKLPEGKDIADLRGELLPEYFIQLER